MAERPSVLVFPGGMPAGMAHRDRARASGLRVVGASSLSQDPVRDSYDEWEHLPFVTDPAFDAALAAVLDRQAVGSVYTPHYVVWKHLSDRLGTIAPGAQLAACRFPQDEDRDYRLLRDRVAALPVPVTGPAHRPALTALERTGLIRLVGTIPGMCGEEKMAALIEVMRRAPPGDVVEIGSWWGRSAALLVWLARHYGIGNLLCIDPWSADAMLQGDSLLDSTSDELDPEEALRIFLINLAPLAGRQLNFIRARSDDAAPRYRPGLQVHTEAFGTTQYSGRIAVLHIDGNHGGDQAARDTASWAPLVVPGGWIIFDDYEWAFGDGPKHAADAFLAQEARRIAATFRAGPSLIVQLREDADV